MFIRNDKNLSYVRVFHASPDAPPVDIYVNDNLTFEDLAFKNFTEYVPLEKGSYKINVYAAGKKDNLVLTQTLEVPENEVITVAAAGNLDDLQLVPYIEYNPKYLAEGESRIRVIHLSPDAPNVDIIIDGETAFTDVGFLDATDYLNLPAGKYKIDVDIADTKDRVLEVELDFKNQRVYSIYIVGNPPNLSAIQSLDGSTYIRY